MKEIHPSLFTKVMRFPEPVRRDVLEYLGATPVIDDRLSQLINDMSRGFDAAHKAERRQ
ncbi:hypothetical protein [Actibacterium mucosum]|uniref:hypothetical protein n=1 Tax=Actibacterium mucosum TaxID=1087332 RepID=UPI001376C01F|nr:hypothetical protein [Actibacterium mucosum]